MKKQKSNYKGYTIETTSSDYVYSQRLGGCKTLHDNIVDAMEYIDTLQKNAKNKSNPLTYYNGQKEQCIKLFLGIKRSQRELFISYLLNNKDNFPDWEPILKMLTSAGFKN